MKIRISGNKELGETKTLTKKKKFDKREGTSALSFCHNPPQQKGWSAWESKSVSASGKE